MKPYDVTDVEQFLDMESDNHPCEVDKWSILHNGDYVSLHPPRGGRYVLIPRDQFNAIVDWYMADQPTKKKKKAA
jgi:hypothetical protein